MTTSHTLTALLAEIYQIEAQANTAEIWNLNKVKALVADYVNTQISDAVLAIVHGSAASGKMGQYSDIDIMVVRQGYNGIRKHIAKHQDRCLDIIEAGDAHIEGLLANARRSGEDWIVSPLATGEVVMDNWSETARCRKLAKTLFLDGPDAPGQQQIDILRANITGLVSQLCRSKSADQSMMAGLALFAPLTTLLLKQQQSFSHRAKHLADHLDETTQQLNRQLREAYQALLNNQPEPLALLAREILQNAGGWLMAGFENATTLG